MQVGYFEIQPGQEVVLQPQWVWSSFVPVSDNYRLRMPPGRPGDILSCPRCHAPLILNVEDSEPDKDEAERQAKREEIKAAMRKQNPEAKHIDGVKRPDDEVPIILGRTKVKTA